MSSSIWTPPGVAAPAGVIRQHFWHRQWCVDKNVASSLMHTNVRMTRHPMIVDLGAGYDPWPYATDLVDRGFPIMQDRCAVSEISGSIPKQHTVDIDFEPLPFADQSVDFLYTRHTLEDIGNPLFVCREIQRVAKAGYIEVPSPAQEFCRGVDAGKPVWRGHHHHRHFLWAEGNTLYLLPKYPIVETMGLNDAGERNLELMLNSEPIAWNTYFWFDGPFEVKLLRHDVDFTIRGDYATWISRAINMSFKSALELADKHNLKPSDFVANA